MWSEVYSLTSKLRSNNYFALPFSNNNDTKCEEYFATDILTENYNTFKP